MITVHVWSSAWDRYLLNIHSRSSPALWVSSRVLDRYSPGWRSGSPGHAAIEIGSVYVSFWPGEEHFILPLTWSGYNTKSKVEDLSHYRASRQNHWFRTIPNNLGGPGLDEEKMLTRWNEIQLQNPDYTTKFQCSAVVNELLIAGGSKSFVENTFQNFESWFVYAVSPSDVKDYSEALIASISQARQNFSMIDIG